MTLQNVHNTILPIHKNKSRSISQIVRQELLLRKQLFHALHKCIFKLKIGGTHNFHYISMLVEDFEQSLYKCAFGQCFVE